MKFYRKNLATLFIFRFFLTKCFRDGFPFPPAFFVGPQKSTKQTGNPRESAVFFVSCKAPQLSKSRLKTALQEAETGAVWWLHEDYISVLCVWGCGFCVFLCFCLGMWFLCFDCVFLKVYIILYSYFNLDNQICCVCCSYTGVLVSAARPFKDFGFT